MKSNWKFLADEEPSFLDVKPFTCLTINDYGVLRINTLLWKKNRFEYLCTRKEIKPPMVLQWFDDRYVEPDYKNVVKNLDKYFLKNEEIIGFWRLEKNTFTKTIIELHEITKYNYSPSSDYYLINPKEIPERVLKRIEHFIESVV
jgi:hypothetical protein